VSFVVVRSNYLSPLEQNFKDKIVTSLRNKERPRSWFSNEKPVQKNSKKRKAQKNLNTSEEATVLKIAPEMQRSSGASKKMFHRRGKIRAKLFF